MCVRARSSTQLRQKVQSREKGLQVGAKNGPKTDTPVFCYEKNWTVLSRCCLMRKLTHQEASPFRISRYRAPAYSPGCLHDGRRQQSRAWTRG